MILSQGCYRGCYGKMKQWGTEGLANLSLEADVKE